MKNLINLPLQRQDLKLARLLTRLMQRWQYASDAEALLTTAATEIRSFLIADCVQIGQLHADGSSQVWVDSRRDEPLSSRLSLPNCGDAVPLQICNLLQSAAKGLIIDVAAQRIRQSNQWSVEADDQIEILEARALEPAQSAFFAEMGIRSALLVPLGNSIQPSGMIIAYHSVPFAFSETELELVQLVAHHLMGELSQDRAKSAAPQPQLSLDPITRLLHLPDHLDLEAALEATVLAFQGVGGRLYLLPEQKTSTQSSAESVNSGVLADAQLYTYGVQPATSAFTKYAAIEQYHVWHNYFQAHDDLVWAVTDLYQEPKLHSLQAVFQPTPIGSLLIILLLYRQQVLGYLSIFRNGGYSQTSEIAQPSPTNALDGGRGQAALHPTQARPWTEAEIEMGQALGMHFAAAVQRSQGQTQLQTLTTNLEQQVQERTFRLQQLVDRQQALLRVITKIRQSLDIDTIFRTTTREVCQIVKAERVAVYRFNADWGENLSTILSLPPAIGMD